MVKYLYNRDVRTDNTIITLMSTIESKNLVCHERNQFYIHRKGGSLFD